MIRNGLISCADLTGVRGCQPERCKGDSALSPEGPRGHTGEQARAALGVYAGDERKRKGDGNEGANCFQWILKSNPSPQRTDLAARKWNIDD